MKLLPDTIDSEAALDDLLTTPHPQLIEFMRTLSSPLVILGAGGKMGPTLAVLARRAAETAGHGLDVIAVSRFSDASAQRWLEERGVRTVSCDLYDAKATLELPTARDVLFLVGQKF